MISALMLLLTLAAAAWALRASRTPQPGRVPGALWRLGGLFALEHLLFELGHIEMPASAFAVLLAARALVGAAIWSQVAWLSAYGERTKAARVRVAFAGVALLLALAHAPWPVLVVVLIPAALSFGWRAALSTRQLFATSLGGIAVLAFGAFVRFRHVMEPIPTGTLHDLWHYAKWANAIAIAYLFFGVSKSIDGFVRDPSLGIRTIRNRLALSHTLVVTVPLAIVTGLWIFTTWLGVNSERAVVATHAFAAQSDELRSALAQALAAPGDPAAALAAVGSSRRATWPGVRVWRIEGTNVRRVFGDSVTSERALAGWCARADSLVPGGVVELGERRFLGGVARDSLRGGWGVALVPVMEALAGAPSRVAGARLWMRERVPHAPADPRRQRLADSLVRVSRRKGGRDEAIRLTDSLVRSPAPASRAPIATVRAGGDTIYTGTDEVTSDSTGATGGASLSGVQGGAGGWSKRDFYLRAHVTFSEAMTGLYRSARENPYNVVPISILGALLLLTLPVTFFNFRLVRQLGRSFLQPVSALQTGTRALGESRLDYRIDVRGDDELWDAAQAFNKMSEGLERARELEIARDRLEHELDLARRIQQRLLPDRPPSIEGLEIAGVSVPAREVGGDYFDHIPLGGGRVMLVIADVSGKGVPAALLMSAFRASLMSQESGLSTPAEVTARLNAFLHRSVDPGKFVTAFVGFLDGASGRLVYANAGHNPPAIVRADGTVEWLATGGLILGIMAEARFESGESSLNAGDLLALYTDGVTECPDSTGEQFGEDRLIESLRHRGSHSCEHIVRELVNEVRAFEGDGDPADDITILLARVIVLE